MSAGDAGAPGWTDPTRQAVSTDPGNEALRTVMNRVEQSLWGRPPRPLARVSVCRRITKPPGADAGLALGFISRCCDSASCDILVTVSCWKLSGLLM